MWCSLSTRFLYHRVTDLQAENFQSTSIYNSFLKTKCIVNHYPWKVIHADEYNIQLFEVWLILSNWIGRKYSNIMRFLTRYLVFICMLWSLRKLLMDFLFFICLHDYILFTSFLKQWIGKNHRYSLSISHSS